MKESWLPSGEPCTLRNTTHLSMIAAMRGMCSQISRPGTLVRIGRNSPRISLGASIFMSYMSWCAGAPHM